MTMVTRAAIRSEYSATMPDWLSMRNVRLVMSTLLILSVIATLYVSDLNRRLQMQLQTLEGQTQQILLEHNRLLMDQAAWSSEERVYSIAKKHLHMDMPTHQQVVMVRHEKRS